MKKLSIIYLVALAVLLSSISVMGKTKKLGQKIPKGVAVVKLSEILKSPEKFKDKEVALQGNYINYCCASDFVYREGLESVEIYPQGFPTPKLDKGKQMKVWGIVRVREKTELEEKEMGKEAEEEEHHQIIIEAKGLEVK